ncbi:uncharacterized protein OCT59_026318 [Rhizophagus irregularis]|uniref:uncharacterized protein n=1 Tax=Rhizophagus irregularis TaxID=588596 RepID=UPI003333E6E1|nr:hypothetical protein OCT59_026318 [Rhizophagus irregularis]
MTLNDMVSFPQLIASATSKTTLPDETRDPLLTKMIIKFCNLSSISHRERRNYEEHRIKRKKFNIQLYNFMKHTGSCLVLLQLFDRIPNKGIWKSIMDYCWKKSLDRLNIENPLPNNILTTNNYGFGILDGNVQKIKVENVISKINFPLQISDEIIDNWYDYSNNYYSHFRIKEDFKLLNAHLFSPYMNAIRKLFVVASSNYYVQKRELEFNQWKIKIDDEEIELRVLKDKWYRTSTKFDSDYSNFEKYLISSSLFDNGDILILTTIGLFIYHFNEDNKSISLNYYYHMYLKYLKYMEYMNFIPGLLGLKLKRYYYYHYYYYYYKKLKFSTPTLPLLNYESFKLNDEWTSYLIDNKSSLLKYGVELLSFSIKEHKFELIEDIYKKCIIYFRQDLRNNSKFLSIITSTMPLLNEHFPEYILRYSLETAMIIDSPIYSLKHRNINLHLYSFFKHPPKVNLIHPPILCDPSALSNKWAYKEHPALIILIVLFSFMIVVYLMNLFIGLLNKAIEKDNNRISYLMQKAEILVEIELFYLLPHQRRWEAWFPEVIHYYADVVKAREKVKEMISKGEWNINDFPELKKDLLDKLNIQYNPVNSEIIRRDA